MYYSQLKLNRWFFPKPLLLKSEKFLFHYSFGATKLEDLLLIQGFSTIFFLKNIGSNFNGIAIYSEVVIILFPRRMMLI